MARIKIEGVIEYLGDKFSRALREAVYNTSPDTKVEEYELFREFKRSVANRFDSWERVPDNYIEMEK